MQANQFKDFLKSHPLNLILATSHPHHNPLDIAKAAIAGGGVGLIQIRDKMASAKALIEFVKILDQGLDDKAQEVVFLINDRVDIALALSSILNKKIGVHLGQSDIPARLAREMLGVDAIIGLTIKSESDLLSAPLAGLNYISIGGVFATKSKVNPDPPIGLEGLSHLIGLAKKQNKDSIIGAIAGIGEDNIAEISALGVDFVALIGALSDAASLKAIEAKSLKLANLFTNAKAG